MVHLGRFGPSGKPGSRQAAWIAGTLHDFGPGQDVTGGPSRPGHDGDVVTFGPFWDDGAGRASYCLAQSAVVQDGVLLCLGAHSARSVVQMPHRFSAGVARRSACLASLWASTTCRTYLAALSQAQHGWLPWRHH